MTGNTGILLEVSSRGSVATKSEHLCHAIPARGHLPDVEIIGKDMSRLGRNIDLCFHFLTDTGTARPSVAILKVKPFLNLQSKLTKVQRLLSPVMSGHVVFAFAACQSWHIQQ
jgi:hypothetical protein